MKMLLLRKDRKKARRLGDSTKKFRFGNGEILRSLGR